jgi:hypothetical protein
MNKISVDITREDYTAFNTYTMETLKEHAKEERGVSR